MVYVNPPPRLAIMDGKVKVMTALITHMKKMAVPFMMPRTFAWNISPSMVHTTVPLVDCTMSINTAIRPRMRYGAHVGGVVLSAMCGAIVNWKVPAMTSKVMPTAETSKMSKLRRLNLRISHKPPTEPMTDMTPLATCAVIEAEVVIPAYSSTFGA